MELIVNLIKETEVSAAPAPEFIYAYTFKGCNVVNAIDLKQYILSVLKARGETAFNFAARANVSPATISRILNGSATSLNTSTLKKIVRTLDCELTLTSEINAAREAGKILGSMKFTKNAFDEGALIYAQAFARAQGKSAVYICDTIPEILKTAPILAAELGKQINATKYSELMNGLLSQSEVLNNITGAVFIDEFVIKQLIAREGAYSSVTKEESDAQLKHLYAFFEATFPKIQGYVVNFKRSGLTTAFAIDDGYGVQFSYGGYLEWQNPDFNKEIFRRSHEAMSNGVGLTSYLSSQELEIA